MKNVNIFIDVDYTLVDHLGRLMPGVADGLRLLRESGCTIYLWSTGGRAYCQEVAARHGVTELFEAFLPKPDIIIDETPHTIVNGFKYDIHDEDDWLKMAERIRRAHVDPPKTQRRRPNRF